MAKGTSQHKKQTGKGKGLSKYHDAERRQGRRFFFVWLPIIIVVLLFFYGFVFDPPRPFGQPVPGTFKEGEQARSGEGIEKVYQVVLDDGRTVKLDGPHMGSIESGRRLLIQENETLIFKRKSFTFVRYIKTRNE
jgi:hypothetical protein